MARASLPQCHDLSGVLQDYLIALSTPQDDQNTLDISDLHSPFEVQEYLTSLVAQDPHNVQRLVELPKFTRDDSTAAAGPSQSTEIDPDDFEEQQHVERDVWLFEHLRSAIAARIFVY